MVTAPRDMAWVDTTLGQVIHIAQSPGIYPNLISGGGLPDGASVALAAPLTPGTWYWRGCLTIGPCSYDSPTTAKLGKIVIRSGTRAKVSVAQAKKLMKQEIVRKYPKARSVAFDRCWSKVALVRGIDCRATLKSGGKKYQADGHVSRFAREPATVSVDFFKLAA